MQNDIKYNIDIASKRTGLTKNTIRAWEQRYNFLNPERTDTKRRLYSEDEIEKLSLLANATHAGYKIGNIYNLTAVELKELLSKTVDGSNNVSNSTGFDFSGAIECVKKFDDFGLRKILEEALIEFSKPVFLKDILIPLIESIGELWHSGDLRISQEHFATSVITGLLARLRENEPKSENSRTIVVCTPMGQKHELGALAASVIIASYGWHVVYLGAELPAEEIAFAVQRTKADAIAISAIFPVNETQLETEIIKLHKFLPDTRIIIGSKFIAHQSFELFKNITIVEDYHSIFALLS
jgi:MerR family transcriptional regulator, light-induced transcriptional regulator